MDTQSLGKRIRLVRKEQGHTGEELAELCHISPTYLRQIESGVFHAERAGWRQGNLSDAL